MSGPLGDLDWLTRSENRVTVLELLAAEPREYAELQDAIGVSRVTMNRMLDDLEEHGWLMRASRTEEHRITPCGRLVIDEITEALDAVATARKLRDVQQYLPVESFDFDLRQLENAEVVTPTRTNTVAPLKSSADLALDADYIRVVSEYWDIIHVQAVADYLREHPESIDIQLVFLGDSLDAIAADSDMAHGFREVADRTSCKYYYHPDEWLYALSIFGETVVLELNDGQGAVPATVISDDEEVLAWAEERFERYRNEADPLDTDVFSS